MSRKLSAYEHNQLLKHNLDPNDYLQTDKPVEYITSFAEFRGSDFIVNGHTLIPRTETEELIDLALKDLASIIAFADIGTGSGAIGISFASELIKKNIQFEAYLSDISEDTLKVVKENVDKILDPKHQNCFTNKVQNSQIKVIQSNLFDKYPKNKKFDIIFANLPYIPSNRINELANSVKNHEPITALDGGSDGLEVIRKFLNQAASFLNTNGKILMEVDDSHTAAEEFSDTWDIKILNDSNGKNRFWIASIKKDLLN